MNEQFTQADLNDVTASLIGRGFQNVQVELEDENDATVIVASFDNRTSANVSWREMVEFFENKYGFCSFPEPEDPETDSTTAGFIIERE